MELAIHHHMQKPIGKQKKIIRFAFKRVNVCIRMNVVDSIGIP